MQLALSQLDWQGQNRFDMGAADQQLTTSGALALQGVALAADELALGVSDLDWQGEVGLAMTADQGLALIDGQHQLKLSDLSLQQGSAVQAAVAAASLRTGLRGEKLNLWSFSDSALDLEGVRFCPAATGTDSGRAHHCAGWFPTTWRLRHCRCKVLARI